MLPLAAVLILVVYGLVELLRRWLLQSRVAALELSIGVHGRDVDVDRFETDLVLLDDRCRHVVPLTLRVRTRADRVGMGLVLVSLVRGFHNRAALLVIEGLLTARILQLLSLSINVAFTGFVVVVD